MKNTRCPFRLIFAVFFLMVLRFFASPGLIASEKEKLPAKVSLAKCLTLEGDLK
jgi:hypothetical protein